MNGVKAQNCHLEPLNGSSGTRVKGNIDRLAVKLYPNQTAD
jgi:hypothetical protein